MKAGKRTLIDMLQQERREPQYSARLGPIINQISKSAVSKTDWISWSSNLGLVVCVRLRVSLFLCLFWPLGLLFFFASYKCCRHPFIRDYKLHWSCEMSFSLLLSWFCPISYFIIFGGLAMRFVAIYLFPFFLMFVTLRYVIMCYFFNAWQFSCCLLCYSCLLCLAVPATNALFP